MEPPQPQGDWLAVIVGSGFAGLAIDEPHQTVEYQVLGRHEHLHVVEVHECGHYLMVRRHGPEGSVPAHLVDHRANIAALCEAGASRVIGLASVGSMRAEWGVGTAVAPDDFFALGAYASFWDDTRGHAIPGFDLEWRARAVEAWQSATDTALIDGAVYAETRGPRFETPAEVRFLAQHADLVGMTIASESNLAREAGLAYASLCKVDNLANGIDPDGLTMAEVAANTEATREQWLADIGATLRNLGGVAS